MSSYRWTVIGLLIAGLVFMLTAGLNFALFETLIVFLRRYEHLEVDGLVISLLVLLAFVVADVVGWYKARELEKGKVKVHRAMIFAMHHILNNFLHQMQIFRMTASDTPEFDQELLSLYDQIIDETSSKIKSLSDIEKVDEATINDSLAITSPPSIKARQKPCFYNERFRKVWH